MKTLLLFLLLITACKPQAMEPVPPAPHNIIAEALAHSPTIPGKEFLATDCTLLETLTDDQFLERIQFDYTRKCLAKKDELCTIENDGFRISLLCIAVANNWIERDIATAEVLQYLHQFRNAKTVHGIMPRTFDRTTGENANVIYGNFAARTM